MKHGKTAVVLLILILAALIGVFFPHPMSILNGANVNNISERILDTSFILSGAPPAVSVAPEVVNPDDTNRLYAAHKMYYVTVNTSLSGGFSGIEAVWFAFRNNDTGTNFVEIAFLQADGLFYEQVGPSYVELDSSSSSNITAGDTLNVTFAFWTETAFTAQENLYVFGYANDTGGQEASKASAVQYDIENRVTAYNNVIIPDEGPTGTLAFISGLMIYYGSDSLIAVEDDYYDLWLVSQNSTIQVEVSTWDDEDGDDGYFEGVILCNGPIGIEAILLMGEAEDDVGRDGTDLSGAAYYVYFTVMTSHGDDDDAGDWEWWYVGDDPFIMFVFLIVMMLIIGGCCVGIEGCGGCGGCDWEGCGSELGCGRTRIVISIAAWGAALRRFLHLRRGYSKYDDTGHYIWGGLKLITPFKYIKRGMANGKAAVSIMKSIAKALRFKR